MLTNAYDELMSMLAVHCYTVDDIAWVADARYRLPLPEFLDRLKDTNYYAGYGSVEFDPSIVVMLDDGSWFERAEYDGSEWWQYRYVPTCPVMVLSRGTEYSLICDEQYAELEAEYSEDQYDQYWDELEEYWVKALKL